MNTDWIRSGAITVAHMAEHMGRMKERAAAMHQSFGARGRGYFTPSEDEQVRHLLISYWNSRNALFELVLTAKDFQELPPEHRSDGFLVGFAGAILLVNAARFLRETFEDSKLVRMKLNEAEPTFGIPEGTYDTVQASLTRPTHLWHLYHAVRYFETNERALRQRAKGTELEAVLKVIDSLGHRLQVELSDLVSARLRVRAREVADSVRKDLLGRAIYGLQRAVSKFISGIFVKPNHRPRLPSRIDQQLRDVIEPGDVLITRKEFALTNYFLPGYWPHAALYLGGVEQNEETCVLEALKDGVRLRSIASPLGSDSVTVVRPKLSGNEIQEAIQRGLCHEGKPYDFDFDFTRSDRMVCTEVVYRTYEGIGGIRFHLTSRTGRMTLSAEDILEMALDNNHFETVAAYAPLHARRKLLMTNDAASAISETLRPEGR